MITPIPGKKYRSAVASRSSRDTIFTFVGLNTKGNFVIEFPSGTLQIVHKDGITFWEEYKEPRTHTYKIAIVEEAPSGQIRVSSYSSSATDDQIRSNYSTWKVLDIVTHTWTEKLVG